MTWTEIKIHTTNEAVEPITNLLHEDGVSGVVINEPLTTKDEEGSRFGEIYDLDPNHYPTSGVYITFYLPSNEHTDEQLNNVRAKIKQLNKFGIHLGPNTFHVREIKEENWSTAWKKYYHTVKMTDKITIKPMWENYKSVSTDEIVVTLDPGMAFGTGTHPTTKLSVEALEKYVHNNDHVIDVGCGSGILSIVATLLGAEQVLSLDLDDIAIKSTKLNAKLNDVNEQLIIKKNNLLAGINMEANVIVSNILAEIIIQFPHDAYANLVKGGLFITSGIIDKKEHLVISHLQAAGFTILETNHLDNWMSIIAKKL